MRIQKHPSLPLWIREDGAVCMPPDGHRFFKFRWTYGRLNRDGYLQVCYLGKTYRVHRLVAEAFLGDPPFSGATVDHINRVKTANFVANLRWADSKMQQDNTRKVDTGLAKYGVRECEDIHAYQRVYQHAYRAQNAVQQRAKVREWVDKQRALGRRCRKCPDGKQHWLTDEEFDALYKKSSLMAGNSV